MSDDLWLVDTGTRQTRKVTSDLHVMSAPRWSPDGEYIAFNAMKHSEFWYGDQSDAYVVEMPEQMVRKVSMNTYVSDRNGSIAMEWSPDSEHLFFRYEWEGDANLWSVPVEGGVATKMTYEEGNFGDFTVSPDGSAIVYVRSTPTRGGEIYRLDLRGGPPVQLTDWYRNYKRSRSAGEGRLPEPGRVTTFSATSTGRPISTPTASTPLWCRSTAAATTPMATAFTHSSTSLHTRDTWCWPSSTVAARVTAASSRTSLTATGRRSRGGTQWPRPSSWKRSPTPPRRPGSTAAATAGS